MILLEGIPEYADTLALSVRTDVHYGRVHGMGKRQTNGRHVFALSEQYYQIAEDNLRKRNSQAPLLFIETGDEIVKTSFFQDITSLSSYYEKERQYTTDRTVLRLRGNNPAKYLSPQEWSHQSGCSARSYVAKAGQYLFVCLNPPYYNEALPYGTQKYNSRFVYEISNARIPFDILTMQYVFEQDAQEIIADIQDNHNDAAGIIILSHAPMAKTRSVKGTDIFFPQSLLCHGYTPFEGIQGEYSLRLGRQIIDDIKALAGPKVLGWITGHMHLPEEKMKEGMKRIIVPAFTLAADEHGTPCPPVGHYSTTILKPNKNLHLENSSIIEPKIVELPHSDMSFPAEYFEPT